jgi:peptidoglycan hydrolase CwlO-like protein
MIAKLEDEVNSLKASNEELQAQIDSKEVKIHGFENDVEQLRSSLVMNTGAAAEL